MIQDKLNKLLKSTDKNKSSHWQHHLNNQNPNNIYSGMGFGSFTKKNLIKSPIYRFLSSIVFNNNIFTTKEYHVYKNIFDKMNRQIDVDAIRHIFTFNFLKKYKKIKRICVIGDGKANFIIGALNLLPNVQIFSINLTEVLINDYLILYKFKLIDDENIQVIENLDIEIDNKKKLFLIPASFKNFCYSKNIDLFVNIASFQEMNIKEIEKYFDIIKNNKSLFYCCNREDKTLYGGERLIFNDYPWGNGKKIIYEDCPWHQRYYSLKPPFIHKLDGNIKHCLISYE